MDEPTASLTEHEVETLFAVMRRLKDRGVSIIFISHHLDEIFVIADRVTVLRDGNRVSCRVVRDTERGQIVRDMIGGEMVTFDKNRVSLDERPAVLKVEHLAVGQRVRNVSFEVHAGEVLGLYGLVGAGQELVADALVGIAQPEGGTITLLGQRFRPRSPRDAITAGVGIVPSDRKADGLELRMSIGANLTLPSLPLLSRAGLLNLRRERVVARKASTDVKVKGAGIDGIVASLSGGNQQKVVLGRWLVRQVQLLVLVDPTRGVDVGAKSDIYRLIESLTDRGMAVVLVSADLPEVCSMSDHIAVFVRGDLVTIVEGSRTSQEDVLALAAGGA
jgi:ABC-type sugar transport system ATPase subunit